MEEMGCMLVELNDFKSFDVVVFRGYFFLV